MPNVQDIALARMVGATHDKAAELIAQYREDCVALGSYVPPHVSMVRADVAKAQLDNAYDERNRLVAALARFVVDGGRAWLGRHEGDPDHWDPEWLNVVYVELPTGQCSWHVHDGDLPLFAFLQGRPALRPWDGHSTIEKYDRVDAFANGKGR
jgi:hypothetical protein